MQTIYTHGTVLQAENPEQLLGFSKYGWGTQIAFVKPKRGTDPRIPDALEENGPGSWFHLPLTSMPAYVGLSFPYLTSVFLLFETDRCRISDLHIYDGPSIVEKISYPSDALHVPGGLHGSLAAPFKHDLATPHRIQYAVGLSFFALSYYNDFFDDNPDPSEPGILIVGAGGAQYDLKYSLFSGGIGHAVEGP
jgi:hypothetical protein